MVALDEDEHIPSSSDSIRVYSMRVTSPERSPRKRSPERSPRKRPASSGADVPAVDLSAAATESVGGAAAERPVPQLLRDGAKQVAILRLIRGHDRKATLALFQLRDRRGNGTVRRRDMLRVLASPVLDLRFTKAERGLVADRYQLSETKRCVYEGLVDALHQNDPSKIAVKSKARQAAKERAHAEYIARSREASQATLALRTPFDHLPVSYTHLTLPTIYSV